MSRKATAIFDADDSKLQKTIAHIDERLLGVQERFARAGEVFTRVLEATAAVEGAKKLAEGIETVLEVGSHFHDLSANTGAAVGELVVLEQQFKSSGKAAEDIMPVLTHMQRVLGEGSSNALIGDLGIELEDLKRKAPVQQMEMLGKAIAGLKNPTDRSYAAMQLFGKEGASLISMFKEEGGFADAAAIVGLQAELLDRDAALFASAAAKLGLAGLKTRGFFVGVADEVVPVLMPLLDRFERLDLAPAGQAVGDFINAFAASSDVSHIIVASLMLSATKFLIFLDDGLDSTFTSAAGILIASAATFIAKIDEGMANVLDKLGRVPGMGAATLAGGLLHYSAQGAEHGADVGQQMVGWHHNDGPLDAMARVLDRDLTDWFNESMKKAGDLKAAGLAAHPQLTEPVGEQELQIEMPNVSHLADIGGAFGEVGVMDPLNEAAASLREHTVILKNIEINTAKPSAKNGPAKPVYQD